MPKMYAMRRANGEFFTAANLVAVWAGMENLDRTWVHNRDLDVYRPVLIDERVKERLRKQVGDKGFWLIEPVSPNAELREGRRIDWTELVKLQSQPSLEPPPALYPKVRATVQEIQFS